LLLLKSAEAKSPKSHPLETAQGHIMGKKGIGREIHRSVASAARYSDQSNPEGRRARL
jgi:hypothetical protein